VDTEPTKQCGRPFNGLYIYIYMSKEGSEEDWKCIKKVKMHKNPLTLDLFIPCMGRGLCTGRREICLKTWF
jgi:hypothetical protein